MNKIIKAFFFIHIIFFLFTSFLYSQDTDLSTLLGTPNFFDSLQREYRSKDSHQEAISLIRKFLPVVEPGTNRYTLLMDMAHLEEQQGKLQSAQLHYQSAAFAAGGSPDFEALYQSALLLIDFGHYEQALLQCRHIARESSSLPMKNSALLQEARILYRQDKIAETIRTLDELYKDIENFSAELLYGMYALYSKVYDLTTSDDKWSQKHKKLDNLEQELKARYPESPEYGLLQQNIERRVTADIALGISSALPYGNSPTKDTEQSADVKADVKKDTGVEAENNTNVHGNKPEEESTKSRAIQTGSFQDAENAHYMQQELENQGFTAMVVHAEVQGNTYYRVLVPIAYGSTEEELVLQLKEKGFEGYPIY